MKLNIPAGLHIRPASSSDTAFLAKLHHSTRQDLQILDAGQDLVEELIDMQFRAQQQGYGDKFPDAMYFIIEKHHEAIGKATLDFGHNEIRLIDLAFIPAARNHGFGKAIIQSFQHCAAQTMTPLTLSVLQHNIAAKRLYLSLGFTIDQISPPYELLIWYPASTEYRQTDSAGTTRATG